jgi:hypothetical protein
MNGEPRYMMDHTGYTGGPWICLFGEPLCAVDGRHDAVDTVPEDLRWYPCGNILLFAG